jgi:uncharacterized phiE125 gp8 family phage protein
MCDTVKIKELYPEKAEELISLGQIKSYLKIDFDEQDYFLNEVIATTRQYAEKFLSMHLVKKIYKQINIADNQRKIALIKTPVNKVMEVFIISLSGKKVELKAEEYEFDGFNKILIYRQDIFYKAIEIKYMVGYENINLVPSPIKTGMMIHASSIYDRGDLGDAIPQSTLNLYQPYRRISL